MRSDLVLFLCQACDEALGTAVLACWWLVGPPTHQFGPDWSLSFRVHALLSCCCKLMEEALNREAQTDRNGEMVTEREEASGNATTSQRQRGRQ